MPLKAAFTMTILVQYHDILCDVRVKTFVTVFRL
jgi:hypothetical protein